MDRDITVVTAYDRQEDIRVLFGEYTDMLVSESGGFKKYLDAQNYDDELKNLDKKYGMPYGGLYAAYCGNKLCGCIAFRKIDGESCEMKRLYVRPRFRGMGIGKRLIEKAVKGAKNAGYKYMLLDTFPFLETAVDIYKKFGFAEIKSYNGSPMEGLVYMKLDLTQAI